MTDAFFREVYFVACVLSRTPIVCACLVVACSNVITKAAATSSMT